MHYDKWGKRILTAEEEKRENEGISKVVVYLCLATPFICLLAGGCHRPGVSEINYFLFCITPFCLLGALIFSYDGKRWKRNLIKLFILYLWFGPYFINFGKPMEMLSPDRINNLSMRTFMEDCEKKHVYPLWNPYMFGGMPWGSAGTGGMAINPDYVIQRPLEKLFFSPQDTTGWAAHGIKPAGKTELYIRWAIRQLIIILFIMFPKKMLRPIRRPYRWLEKKWKEYVDFCKQIGEEDCIWLIPLGIIGILWMFWMFMYSYIQWGLYK